MTDRFSWDREENDGIVFPNVDALAVYLNGCGEVVIRQQSRLGEDDRLIFVPIDRVKDLFAAIRKEIAKGRE